MEKVFAFNIWDLNSAKAVMDAAGEADKNLILQTSESIYRKIPQKQMREFVTSYSESLNRKIWLQLDHCRDMEVLQDAIRNQWDIVMIDASDKALADNIAITNQVAQYAHEKGVLVEAEVGQIKGAEEEIQCTQENVAAKEEIEKFLKETEADLIAVAFGNAHGIYKGEPILHYELVEYTAALTKKPFVVHGGSGLTDEILTRLLHYENIKKINISTDVKMAYRRGIQKAYQNGSFREEGFQAIRIENDIHDEIKKMAEEKLKLLDEYRKY